MKEPEFLERRQIKTFAKWELSIWDDNLTSRYELSELSTYWRTINKSNCELKIGL